MLHGLKLAVVIPCFQVEKHIEDVIRRIPAGVDSIITVDDASTDNLQSALDRVSEPRLRRLTHKENRGVGGATVTGMLAAIDGGADVIVKCDGDGQMDPADIPALVL